MRGAGRAGGPAVGERQSVLTDPDGHVVCLVTPVSAGDGGAAA
jgi:hypothetical protein